MNPFCQTLPHLHLQYQSVNDAATFSLTFSHFLLLFPFILFCTIIETFVSGTLIVLTYKEALSELATDSHLLLIEDISSDSIHNNEP